MPGSLEPGVLLLLLSKLIGGLDPSIEETTSITRFLRLPTVIRQKHIKIRDLIFDFT
jgi:hypothetical protein